jgi:hypothetical protein
MTEFIILVIIFIICDSNMFQIGYHLEKIDYLYSVIFSWYYFLAGDHQELKTKLIFIFYLNSKADF